jgi:pyridoxamine 5'-phosphate oxidase
MTVQDPIARFRRSYESARLSETFDVARVALATADAHGRPSVRFVLVKDFDPRGLCFYTSLDSRKAREIAENPYAALSFHWGSTGEQVRFEGPVALVSDAEADAYFASRPRGSQLGAWASEQSAEIASRGELEERLVEVTRRFGIGPVPRPPRWGGLRLSPSRIEFWHDRPDRLHDRELYTRSEHGWTTSLLSP